MKICFVTNYFNHHQKPFCDALYEHLGDDFTFISTIPMREERRDLGYEMKYIPPYVKICSKRAEDTERCLMAIDEADIIIAGSAPRKLIDAKIKKGNLVFKYSERIFKKGIEPIKFIPRLLRYRKDFTHRNVYLLCASAFTAVDYSKFLLFKNKCYKWGYFPETRKYENISEFVSSKSCGKILWCGRFIYWKHPEDAIRVAKKLRENGYEFELDFIGTGEMEYSMRQLILDNNLSDCVKMLGAMKPEQVREHMEVSDIYLFTSDKQEGWGAVLNESMNSGCAVIASHAIGSVPLLIKNGVNGLVYESGNTEMMYEKIKYLLDNPYEKEKMGIAAYNTIINEWNAEVAAKRLLKLIDKINEQGKCNCFENGPCSEAKIIKDDWFNEE